MAYCTLQQIKDHLGITEADDDDLLTALIANAQSIIDGFCHRSFEATADTTRTFDAVTDVWGDTLLFDEDLASITSVTNGDSTTVTASQYVTEPRNRTPYYGITIRSDADVVWTYTDYHENAISIVGRWAYSSTAPSDINYYCKYLAAWLYRQKDTTADIDRPLLAGDGTVVLPQQLPAVVVAGLATYRRRV